MAAPLFYTPVFQAFSRSGLTLPAAELTFYAAGTTTPTDIYADEDLATPLSNPVVADSDGMFPPIFLDARVALRVILNDAAGVEYWDVDWYYPAGAGWFPGAIVAYSGDIGDIPAGWALCDGTDGTPDLRGAFVMGVPGGGSVGDTGGSASETTSASGAHAHTGSTAETVLDEDQIPAHSHSIYACSGSGSSENTLGLGATNVAVVGDNLTPRAYIDDTGSGNQIIEDSGGGDEGHDHTIEEQAAHTHTVDTLPPYVALYYIMFTG